MDKMLYTIHLNDISKVTSKSKLIGLMSKYSSGSTYRRQHFVATNYRLPEFRNRTKEQQINSIYNYMLFVVCRKRYLELDYPISYLPKYAQLPPLVIDLEESIKQIKETHKCLEV